MTTCTKAEYAQRKGVSRPAISQAIRAGRVVVVEDGRVDVEASDRVWDAKTDTLQSLRANAPKRRAQALAPDSISIANNLGLSLLLDGRPDEARAVLEPLARRPDANDRVTANYAISLAATGDVAAARSVLGEAGGDLAALGASFRGGNRQIIEVTPNDSPG